MQHQKQSDHGGTGEQETEIGSTTNNQRDSFAETHPQDHDTVNSGSEDGGRPADSDATVRNPSGDKIGSATEGDEGSDSRY